MSQTANNAINADSKKRRSFVAPLFAAGYGERYRESLQSRGQAYPTRPAGDFLNPSAPVYRAGAGAALGVGQNPYFFKA
jgi:hypothetical protein